MKTEFSGKISFEKRRSEIKRSKPPDISKLTRINIPGMRATFYPANAERLKKKIEELEKLGIEYKILKPEK